MSTAEPSSQSGQPIEVPPPDPITLDQLTAALTSLAPDQTQAHLDIVTVQKGDALFNQGDVADGAYIVLVGALAVTVTHEDGSQSEINRHRPGAVLGEMALLGSRPRTATVTALVDSELLRLNADAYQHWVTQHEDAKQLADAQLDERWQILQLSNALRRYLGEKADASTYRRWLEQGDWLHLSNVLKISKEMFESVAASNPNFMLSVSKSIIVRQQRLLDQSKPRPSSALSIVLAPADDSVDAGALAHQLAEALSPYGEALALDAARFEELTGQADAARVTPSDPADRMVALRLDELEAEYAYMIYANVSTMLKETFGNLQIEDLWLPYYCISTSFTFAEKIVHRRGPLWRAIRASMSVPGVFLPIVEEGNVLVDGGIVDNFPVGVMADSAESDSIIGVHISPYKERKRVYDYDTNLSGWKILRQRVNPFSKSLRTPSLMQTLTQATLVAGMRMSKREETLVDLMITPEVKGFGFTDYDQWQALAERGYEAGLEPLRAWLASHPELTP